MNRYSPFGRFCVPKRRENRQLLVQMADAIGISAERLSSAEIGEHPPRVEWLSGISRFLKLTELEARRLRRILERSRSNASECASSEPFSSAAFSSRSKGAGE